MNNLCVFTPSPATPAPMEHSATLRTPQPRPLWGTGGQGENGGAATIKKSIRKNTVTLYCCYAKTATRRQSRYKRPPTYATHTRAEGGAKNATAHRAHLYRQQLEGIMHMHGPHAFAHVEGHLGTRVHSHCKAGHKHNTQCADNSFFHIVCLLMYVDQKHTAAPNTSPVQHTTVAPYQPKGGKVEGVSRVGQSSRFLIVGKKIDGEENLYSIS